MKRSEMIEKIAEDLLHSHNIFGGDAAEREEVRESTNMSRLRFAAAMLDSAECNGMVPPVIPAGKQFTYSKEDGSAVIAMYTVPTHAWEPESWETPDGHS